MWFSPSEKGAFTDNFLEYILEKEPRVQGAPRLASVSVALGLQVCTTMPGLGFGFLMSPGP